MAKQNFFLVLEKVQVYLFLRSLVSPNMLPNVLPPSLGFLKENPKMLYFASQIIIIIIIIIIYSFYIFENNIIGVEATKVVP